jgi:hypothetical protein
MAAAFAALPADVASDTVESPFYLQWRAGGVRDLARPHKLPRRT